MHRLGGEVSTITTNDQGLAFSVDRIEDGLNKVLGVVLGEYECVYSILLILIANLLLEDLDAIKQLSALTTLDLEIKARLPLPQARGTRLLALERFGWDLLDRERHL